jgi:hypothetical protein
MDLRNIMTVHACANDRRTTNPHLARLRKLMEWSDGRA